MIILIPAGHTEVRRGRLEIKLENMGSCSVHACRGGLLWILYWYVAQKGYLEIYMSV
jgi:hypothetical protein